MTVVTRSAEPQQRVADAVRARATGAGHPGSDPSWDDDTEEGPLNTRLALLIALGAGFVIGVLLALLSVLAPGVLPPLG